MQELNETGMLKRTISTQLNTTIPKFPKRSHPAFDNFINTALAIMVLGIVIGAFLFYYWRRGYLRKEDEERSVRNAVADIRNGHQEGESSQRYREAEDERLKKEKEDREVVRAIEEEKRNPFGDEHRVRE
jgi:flagellar biosynthesis/type III secretory pathway M-ring protein FliF/YscJ